MRELKKENGMAANPQLQLTKRSIKRSAWKALRSPHKTASKFHLRILAEHVSNCIGFLFSGIGGGSSLANVVVMDLSFRLSYTPAHVAKNSHLANGRGVANEGLIADHIGIQHAFFVPVICYLCTMR